MQADANANLFEEKKVDALSIVGLKIHWEEERDEYMSGGGFSVKSLKSAGTFYCEEHYQNFIRNFHNYIFSDGRVDYIKLFPPQRVRGILFQEEILKEETLEPLSTKSVRISSKEILKQLMEKEDWQAELFNVPPAKEGSAKLAF